MSLSTEIGKFACLLASPSSIHPLEIQPKKSNEKKKKNALVMLTARYANRSISQAAVMSRESDAIPCLTILQW